MTAQHHEAHGNKPPDQIDPETQQRLNELTTQISAMDVQIMSLPDSSDAESPIRSLQRERNEVQKEYDELAATIRRGGTIRDLDGLKARDEELTAERDQLVLAQNAPFTDAAPEAAGGESAIPDGVVDSNGPHPRSSVGQPNAVGVIHGAESK